jgi:hypothetical protein
VKEKEINKMGNPVRFCDSGWDKLRAQHRRVAIAHPIVQIQTEWGPGHTDLQSRKKGVGLGDRSLNEESLTAASSSGEEYDDSKPIVDTPADA